MATRSDVLQVRYEVRGDGAVKASLADTEKGFDRINRTATRAGVAIGAALAGAATAAAVAIKLAINEADEMGKVAQRVGVGVEALSELKFAADLSGVSFASLNGALNIFNRTAENNEKVIRAMGVELRNADGTFRDTDKVVRDLADVFSQLPDGMEKSQLAIQLFGRSGAELVPLLNAGSQGIAAMGEEARNLGRVIDQETAMAAAEFNDNLTRLKAGLQGAALVAAREMLPQLVAMSNQVNSPQFREGFAMIASGIAGIVSAAATGVTTIGRLTDSLTAMFRSQDQMSARQVSDQYGALRRELDSVERRAEGADRQERFLGVDRRLRARAEEIRGEMAELRKQQEMLDRQEGGRLGPRGGRIEWNPGSDLSGAGSAGGGGVDIAAFMEEYRATLAQLEEESRSTAKSTQTAFKEALSIDLFTPALEGLERQNALFGETSNAARVLYDIQSGALGALLPQEQAMLLAQAERLDALQQQVELEQEAASFIGRTRTEAEAYAEVLMRLDELQALELITLEERNRIEAAYQPRDRAQDLIADLQFELQLMGMTNAERRTAIQLRQLEGEATADQVEKIRSMNEQLERTANQQDALRELGQVGGRALADLATRAGRTDDVLKNLAATLIQMLAERLFERLAQQSTGLGAGSGGGGGEGIRGSLLASFAGSFSGRATGGMTSAGQRILVGENGPEWRYERTPGMYTPNHQMGGEGGVGESVVVNQTVNVQGRLDNRSRSYLARDTAREFQMASARGRP